MRPVLEYSSSVWDPSGVGLQDELEKVHNGTAIFVTDNYSYETGNMTGNMKGKETADPYCYKKVCRIKSVYLSPWLGTAGIVIL